jgi:ribosome biogenesis GTPase
MSYYQKELEYQVFFVNSKKLEGIDEIKPLIKDKVTVLAGQTGAGKSTFINALIPGFNLETQEISNALGRGKHTTRKIDLYSHLGGLIGDTPGFSKFEVFPPKKEIRNTFKEFNKYQCKFSDCLHIKNALGCAIENNPDILKQRYENYLKMLENCEKRFI